MSEQFEFKGYPIEVDQDHPDGPLMKIGNKTVFVQKVGTRFVVPEPP